MANRTIYLCLLASLLMGCAENAQPPKTLPEQLAGKTPEERQEILRLDCLNAAEKITGRIAVSHPHNVMPSQNVKVSEMKGICRQMTEAYLLQDKPQHVRLEKECDSLLKTVEVNQRNTQAIENMRQICTAMTRG